MRKQTAEEGESTRTGRHRLGINLDTHIVQQRLIRSIPRRLLHRTHHSRIPQKITKSIIGSKIPKSVLSHRTAGGERVRHCCIHLAPKVSQCGTMGPDQTISGRWRCCTIRRCLAHLTLLNDRTVALIGRGKFGEVGSLYLAHTRSLLGSMHLQSHLIVVVLIYCSNAPSPLNNSNGHPMVVALVEDHSCRVGRTVEEGFGEDRCTVASTS